MGLRHEGLCCHILLCKTCRNKVTNAYPAQVLWISKQTKYVSWQIYLNRTFRHTSMIFSPSVCESVCYMLIGRNIFSYCTVSIWLAPIAAFSHLDPWKSPFGFICSNSNGEWGTSWTPCTPSRDLLVFKVLWELIR